MNTIIASKAYFQDDPFPSMEKITLGVDLTPFI